MKVDPVISTTLTTLGYSSAMKYAFTLVKDNQQETLEIQKELALIEAPTGREDRRGRRYRELLKEVGLSEIHTDHHGNVWARLEGTGQTGACIVLDAHLDSALPIGSVQGIAELRDGSLRCPGIADNARGLAANIAVLRALRKAGIRPVHDIIVSATVCEKGLGGMNGMKWLLKSLGKRFNVLAVVSIDGPGEGTYWTNATGNKDWRVSFTAEGGHAFSEAGKPSAIHAAVRAAAKLSELELPADPKVSLTVSMMKGGQTVHSIASSAEFIVNARSDDQKALDALGEKVVEICLEGAAEENRRCNCDSGVVMKTEELLSYPAGGQAEDSGIAQAAFATTLALGITPKPMPGGFTNTNRAIVHKIPSVTFGRCGQEYAIDTLDETYNPKDAYLCEQRSILMLMLLAGLSHVTEPVPVYFS